MMFDWMDLEQFRGRYSSEEACREALFRARWPDGFRCPRCQGARSYELRSRKLYECVDCGYQASLTAGTIMENTRTPLSKWFLALFMVARLDGISATALQKELEVTYKTAWTMLMKIRYAISHNEQSQLLSGRIRFDTAIYGHKIWKLAGFEPGEYPVVVGASVDDNGQPEHLKIKRIPREDAYNKYLSPFLVRRFESEYVDTDNSLIEPFTRMPRRDRCKELRRLVKQAENWINKTFVAISGKHWQQYIDEFCYRYGKDAGYRMMIIHNGNLHHDWRDSCWAYRVSSEEPRLRIASSEVFQSLLYISMNNKPMTYKRITQRADRDDIPFHAA